MAVDLSGKVLWRFKTKRGVSSSPIEYEGLVILSQADLSIVPCIAEKYEVDSTATHFKFYLRKGVRFHDDPCRINKQLQESTDPGRYMLNVPGSRTDNRLLFSVYL